MGYAQVRISVSSCTKSRTADHTLRWASVLGAAFWLFWAVGCGGITDVDGCQADPGTLGCACLADDDCIGDLECVANTCADQSDGGGDNNDADGCQADPGTLGCACMADGDCIGGLECMSNTCVEQSDADRCQGDPGTLGCACTADADCIRGLECVSNSCDFQSGGGQQDGGTSAACQEYCQCMEATCTEEIGYPFADEAACLSACSGFSEAESACWPTWCTEAAGGATQLTHLCEHAWGMFDLDECPS